MQNHQPKLLFYFGSFNYCFLLTIIHSFFDPVLVIYNVHCNDGERVFFNITWQDIRPRDCGDPPVYVTTIKHVKDVYIMYHLLQY